MFILRENIYNFNCHTIKFHNCHHTCYYLCYVFRPKPRSKSLHDVALDESGILMGEDILDFINHCLEEFEESNGFTEKKQNKKALKSFKRIAKLTCGMQRTNR